MHERSDLSRLRNALRDVSPESNLVTQKDSHNVGCFDLLHADTLSTVQVYRKQQDPKTLYLDLESMETAPPYSRGHGQTALLSLFDLADMAGIQTVRVTACDIGRYAFAASYAQCNARHWPGMKQKLLARLDDYAKSGSGTLRAEQAEAAGEIIQASQGQLGELVAQLRIPAIGDAAQPTLAKLLFLPTIKGDEYDAYWTRTERDLARSARPGLAAELPAQPPVRSAFSAPISAQALRAG